MIELSKAFEYADFNHFDRERYPKVSVVRPKCESAVAGCPLLSPKSATLAQLRALDASEWGSIALPHCSFRSSS